MATLSAPQIAAFKNGLGGILTNLQSQVAAKAFAENLPVVGGGLASGSGAGLTKITTLKQALDASLGSLPASATHEQVLAKVNDALGAAGFTKTAKLTGGGSFEVDFSDVSAVKEVEFTAALAGDAGLGHLGLMLTGPANVAGKLGYDFNFRAGLSGGGEAYVESTGTNLLELLLHMDAGKGISVDGSLGGVPYDVKVAAGTTLLDATLGFVLTDADGRLNASEAGGDFTSASIVNGTAKPVFSLAADFAGSSFLPKLVNTLVVEWSLAGAALNPADDNSAFGEKPVVNFKNVGFDIGAFLSGLRADGGFVETALDVAGPVIEICEKLSTPLPVVGDVLQRFGLGGTLIDVFAGPGSAEAQAVKGIASLGGFLKTLGKIKGGGKLDLGSFGFDNSADIRSPAFSLASVQPVVADFGVGVLNSGPVKALADAVSGVPGLAFPIIQTEGEIFKMVLGQAANIVTYDAAPVTFGVSQEIFFPLFFGINGRVGFAASGEINLGLGFDTSGLSAFASSGDAQDLLNGIFFKDYGSVGAEIPEARFTAEITAGVGAGIPAIFEVGVEGGIRGVVNYDFADAFTAADRKLSFDELASVNFNPFAVADISGRIDAFLAFFVESLLYSRSKDLGSVTLFDFDTQKAQANALAQVKLATKSGGGELLINIGARAGERALGGNDVAESIRIDEGKGDVRVSSPKTKTLSGVDLAPLGGQSVFAGITKITANGGQGDDVIVLQPGVKKPSTLDGGAGNDILTGGSGNDIITGGDGFDRIIGGAGNDKIYGDLLNLGGTGTTDVLSGLDGNDTIEGGMGRDEIRGGAGNDTLYGYGTLFGTLITASDTGDDLFGGEGFDVLKGSDGNDTLDGGPGVDVMFGYGGDDTFRVDNKQDLLFSNNAANAVIESTAPFFRMPGGFRIMLLTTRFDEESGVTFTDAISGEGNDGQNFIYGNNAANGIFGKGGNDFLFGLGGDDVLLGGDGDDTLEGGDGDDILYGDNGTNTLRGGNGNDELHGGPGVDVLEGGPGDDVYYTDNIAEISDTGGRDAIASPVSVNLADNPDIEGVQLTGSANANATGTDGDNFLGGNAGKNTLRGLGGKDRLVGGAGDTLEGGFGADVYVVDSEKAVVVEVDETPSLLNSDVVLAKSSFTLPANVENLILIGAGAKFGNGNNENNVVNAGGQDGVRAPLGQALKLDGRGGNDSVLGGDGDDTIYGGNGDDFVFGNGGNDTLRGGKKSGAAIGSDNDELYGGTGDDTLLGGAGNDVLYGDKSVAGDDTGFPAGTGNDVLDGGTGQDQMFGGAGNDRLVTDGLDGDTLNGGDGDDTYVFTGGSFILATINDSGGNDTVESFVDVDLEAMLLGGFPVVTGDIENITLTTRIGANFLTLGATSASGNALANIIRGNALGNTLDGRGGDDELHGEGGNDGLTGGPGRDRLFGGDGDDSLNGGNFSDEDTLHGGDGSDTYFVYAYDLVIEDPKHTGKDTIFYDGAANGYRLPRGVEDLILQPGIESVNGNDLANKIIANASDNVIRAGRGNDSVFARGGNDTISGEGGNDTIDGEDGSDTLDGGSGDDVLRGGSGLDFLRGGDGKDELYGYRGGVQAGGDDATPDNLDGGDGNDFLDGGKGNDILNGGEGEDTMIGGDGDDLFFVDNKKDKIIEGTTGGFDSVFSAISFTIPANVERLGLFGPGALIATGDARGNILIGGNGANLLLGLGGNDTLVGWRGDDTLLGGEGDDLLYGDEGTAAIVSADISGFLGSGDDVLNGGTGADVMHGQRGDDLYLVDNPGDAVIENPGEGVDTIRTTLSTFTLPAGVERLIYVAKLDASANPAPGKAVFAATFFGNDLPNTIIAGLGNEYLDGQQGADILIGGKGDDIYVVDTIADRVVERANEGTDLVLSRADDFTLPDHVENLDIIAGLALSIGTGNALANVINGDAGQNGLFGEGGNDRLFGREGDDLLIGGDGNDLLDGGTGADEMQGGDGDDTYHVDNAGDTIEEAANQGFDTVKLGALLNYAVQVGQSIEKVIITELAGPAAVTGNAIANIIIGNAENNGLFGGGGNDTLEGGAGNDNLTGADPASRGAGEIDTLKGGEGADLFFLGDLSGIYYDDGNPTTPGKSDFALITDFKPADGDKLAFFGTNPGIIAALTGVTANLGRGDKFYAGIGIFRDFDLDGVVDDTGRNPDELLALLHNFTGNGLEFADYAVFLQV